MPVLGWKRGQRYYNPPITSELDIYLRLTPTGSHFGCKQPDEFPNNSFRYYWVTSGQIHDPRRVV